MLSTINLVDSVIDEVALEGLDGLTLEGSHSFLLKYFTRRFIVKTEIRIGVIFVISTVGSTGNEISGKSSVPPALQGTGMEYLLSNSRVTFL